MSIFFKKMAELVPLGVAQGWVKYPEVLEGTTRREPRPTTVSRVVLPGTTAVAMATALLAAAGPVRNRDLMRATGLWPSQVTRFVRRWMRAGWVQHQGVRGHCPWVVTGDGRRELGKLVGRSV